jgi:hypothetical protein
MARTSPLPEQDLFRHPLCKQVNLELALVSLADPTNSVLSERELRVA